jgi:two-component system, OmpR family, response regulator
VLVEVQPTSVRDRSAADCGLLVSPRLRGLHVLVSGDNLNASRIIISHLNTHGMYATCAWGLPGLIGQVQQREPHLVILDVNRANELAYLRLIRARSDLPVIMIGNVRSDEADPVVCLECGADDWIARPFGLRELFARVHAVLKWRIKQNIPVMRRYRFAGWQLDCQVQRLTSPSGTTVRLTKSEFALLVAFVEAPQRPLSRGHLLRATRIHESVSDRAVDVQVHRLRSKIGDCNGSEIIQTELGLGYVFSLPVEVAGENFLGRQGAWSD